MAAPYDFQPYDAPGQSISAFYKRLLELGDPPPAAPMSVTDMASYRPPFDFQAQPGRGGPVEPAVRPPVDDPSFSSRPTPTTALRGSMNRFEEYGPAGPMRAEGFQGLPPQTGDGWGTPVSQGQFAQDAIARNLINARSKSRLADIDAQEAARGNPMDRQIEADAQMQKYIGGRPAISRSRIAASVDGQPVAMEEGDLLTQGLTVDEAIRQRQGERTAQIGALGKTLGNPQQRSNAELNEQRSQIFLLAQGVEAAAMKAFDAGTIDKEKMDDLIFRAWELARKKSNVLKNSIYEPDPLYRDDRQSDQPAQQ